MPGWGLCTVCVHLRAYLITTNHWFTYFAPLSFRDMDFLVILCLLQFLARFRGNLPIPSVANHWFCILWLPLSKGPFLWCCEIRWRYKYIRDWSAKKRSGWGMKIWSSLTHRRRSINMFVKSISSLSHRNGWVHWRVTYRVEINRLRNK